MLLPLQGAFAAVSLPRALPWAMGCWAFSPLIERSFLNMINLRKLSSIYFILFKHFSQHCLFHGIALRNHLLIFLFYGSNL